MYWSHVEGAEQTGFGLTCFQLCVNLFLFPNMKFYCKQLDKPTSKYDAANFVRNAWCSSVSRVLVFVINWANNTETNISIPFQCKVPV
jgi:hypothetical protein